MQTAVNQLFQALFGLLVCMLVVEMSMMAAREVITGFFRKMVVINVYFKNTKGDTNKTKMIKKNFFVSVENAPVILHFRLKAVYVFYDFALFLVDQLIYLFSGCFFKSKRFALDRSWLWLTNLWLCAVRIIVKLQKQRTACRFLKRLTKAS